MLGNFLNSLIAQLDNQNVVLPSNGKKWHELFYKLKTSNFPNKPDFLKNLQFDWDGQYPKSPQLEELLNGIRCFVCVPLTNKYEVLTMQKEISTQWLNKYKTTIFESYLKYAIEKAKEKFNK